MNSSLHVRLETTAEQRARLAELQTVFAAACNHLAPIVQRSACWNRVALHHMAYRALRERFPALGSQMACNALYSVCRAARWVYQDPHSPFNLQRLAGAPLPLLQFMPESPVYFDRHTLSLKNGVISLYTLDGRMRFNLPVTAEEEQRFCLTKIREIVLNRQNSQFMLSFIFSEGLAADAGQPPAGAAAATQPEAHDPSPGHLLVHHGNEAVPMRVPGPVLPAAVVSA